MSKYQASDITSDHTPKLRVFALHGMMRPSTAGPDPAASLVFFLSSTWAEPRPEYTNASFYNTVTRQPTAPEK